MFYTTAATPFFKPSLIGKYSRERTDMSSIHNVTQCSFLTSLNSSREETLLGCVKILSRQIGKVTSSQGLIYKGAFPQ